MYYFRNYRKNVIAKEKIYEANMEPAGNKVGNVLYLRKKGSWNTTATVVICYDKKYIKIKSPDENFNPLHTVGNVLAKNCYS